MRSTSLTEARIVVVRSRTIVVSIPCGNRGLDGRQLRAYAVDRVDDIGAGLAEDDHVTARLPFKYPAVRTFCTESMTSATSDRWTAAPLL